MPHSIHHVQPRGQGNMSDSECLMVIVTWFSVIQEVNTTIQEVNTTHIPRAGQSQVTHTEETGANMKEAARLGEVPLLCTSSMPVAW